MGGLVRKAVLLAAGLGAILAAAGAAVVALCFAIYAGLKDMISPAGASAVVALVAVVLMGTIALVLLRKQKGPKPKPHNKRAGAEPEGFAERALDMARERPLLAAGAALAAGLLALRNPSVISALVGAAALRANAPPRR